MLTPEEAPLQGDEGAPDAWLVLAPAVIEELRGLEPGIDIHVLTWLDRANRDVLTVHPRECSAPAPPTASTRSACTA